MYRRTFEVIAKYIAQQTNVTIVFDTDGGAYADMKKDILHMPKDIGKSHAYAAIALMMHEAAHIRHSKVIPIEKVTKTKAEFNILNAIEDVRIDLFNFRKMRNIKSFYQELINEVLAKVDQKVPVADRAMCWGILKLEGFKPHAKFGIDARELGGKITSLMLYATDDIDRGKWKDLRDKILEIKKILQIPSDKDPALTPQEMAGLQMGGNVDGPLGEVQGILKGGVLKASGQGDSMEGGGSGQLGTLAMEEQAANQFKEILNVKERKVVDCGTKLDTDALVSFKTGDIDTLFKDEKIIKKKKSKIFFLMDGSGSMADPLLDGMSRARVVSNAVKKLTEILDEVSSIEGLNVEWDVGMFRRAYIPLDKETWQMAYGTGGGTEFAKPFKQVMDAMLNDYTIDGKRIIIAFTDGDVADWEIDDVKEYIVKNYSDVRSLIISVGSEGSSRIVKEITGDNIILAEENAVPVIMETIKALL